MNNDVCRPLLLTDEVLGLPSCHVCGNGPAGVVPGREGLRYALTVPLWDDQTRYLSLFLPKEEDMRAMSGRWQSGGIAAVLHGALSRSATPTTPICEHTAHGIVLEEHGPDVDEVEPGVFEKRHGSKLGGRPAFNRLTNNVDREFERLESEGFRFLLQLDWPTLAEDATQVPKGWWPFGDSTFFLAVRTEPALEIRWLWQL